MRPSKYCQRACDAPLPEGATISSEAAQQMKVTHWPVNEEQTTREIYEAAEAIREVRPRDPVGYAYAELTEVPLVSFMGLERRGVNV